MSKLNTITERRTGTIARSPMTSGEPAGLRAVDAVLAAQGRVIARIVSHLLHRPAGAPA